ncbi:MAG TPA: hypothetical protein VNA20_07615 [Frankiaceae bacterium]|nr:hypothetical protein [Frankiaceae bacterium]
MVKNDTRNAIREDRALTAAHLGAGLPASCAPTATSKTTGMSLVSFAGVPAYVADQGSHPPRGSSPV